jgi:CHAT domain-containing protein
LHDFGLQELDANKEKKHISEALHEWNEAGLIRIEVMDNAIVPELREKLRRFQPHVLHFIGHGGFPEIRGEDRGCLVLEDEERRCKLVEEKAFGEVVDEETTRLVVLNACETAASSSIRALSGLAPRLVQAGMSAVVAMRYPIKDGAAITFSREFYRALASGLAVDAAVADARRGLFLEWGADHRSWFTPVVFMRAPDERLFDIDDR